jgi:hypothetical protein
LNKKGSRFGLFASGARAFLYPNLADTNFHHQYILSAAKAPRGFPPRRWRISQSYLSGIKEFHRFDETQGSGLYHFQSASSCGLILSENIEGRFMPLAQARLIMVLSNGPEILRCAQDVLSLLSGSFPILQPQVKFLVFSTSSHPKRAYRGL